MGNMDKKKLIIRAIPLSISCFCFFKAFEILSITSVLNQRNDAFRNAKLRVRRNGEITEARFVNSRQYLNELYKIDTSHCPKKFQLAWLDYVQAGERDGRAKERVITDFAVAAVTYQIFSLRDAVSTTEKSIDERELAEQNLERVALEYDVRVVHKQS